MQTNSPQTTSTRQANPARGTRGGGNTATRGTGTARGGRGRGRAANAAPVVPFRALKQEKTPAEKAQAAFRLLNPQGFRQTTLFQGGQLISYDEIKVDGSWVTTNVAAEMLQQRESLERDKVAVGRANDRLGREITLDQLATLAEDERSVLFMSAKEWRARRTQQTVAPQGAQGTETPSQDSSSQEEEGESA